MNTHTHALLMAVAGCSVPFALVLAVKFAKWIPGAVASTVKDTLTALWIVAQGKQLIAA